MMSSMTVLVAVAVRAMTGKPAQISACRQASALSSVTGKQHWHWHCYNLYLELFKAQLSD